MNTQSHRNSQGGGRQIRGVRVSEGKRGWTITWRVCTNQDMKRKAAMISGKGPLENDLCLWEGTFVF
jgi:hypothetical protein